MFLPKLGVDVELVSSFSWIWPAESNGEPFPSRSRQARVSVRPMVVSGLLSSVLLPAARPVPATYRATLALIAVLPLPNTSNATPTRVLTSFQFSTRPVQPWFRLLIPSGQSLNCVAAFQVLAGRLSGSVALWK